MREMVNTVLDVILGTPRNMPPDEIELRVKVLESQVESNRLALQQHKTEQHGDPPS